MTTKYEMYDSQESAGTLFGIEVQNCTVSRSFLVFLFLHPSNFWDGVRGSGEGGGAEVKSLENEVEFSPIKGTCIF